MRPSLIFRFASLVGFILVLGACFPEREAIPQRVTVAPPTAPPVATSARPQVITPAPPGAKEAAPPATSAPAPTATPTNTPVRSAIGLAAPADSPAAASLITLLAAAGVPAELTTSAADLQIVTASPADGLLAWEQILTPVDRMSSVLAAVDLGELTGVWTGQTASADIAHIYASPATISALESLLGPAGAEVVPTAAEDIDAAIWDDKLGLAIVPFDALSVRLRAIPIEGESPVSNQFDAADWPLVVRSWLTPLTDRGRDVLDQIAFQLPLRNRDAGKLTTLIMTGVTAIARNSAVAIERSGDWGFLAREVGPELAAADITIISNEIPFIKDCQADNRLNNLILCSRYEYWENLTLSGVDAIGLSGNHQNDFGYDAMRESLAFYEEHNIPVYGGGVDEKAAWQPLILEHNGNRLGFLAANQWGPEWYYNGAGESVSSWAGADWPGSARFTLERMAQEIRALKPQVDLVFAEVQHTEFNAAGDYQTEPIAQQETDFRGMIDAGAAVVTGVQAHAPQAMELRSGNPILYGLGNLYFDQTWSWPTRTGLVVRHTIYDGRLLNTELLVTVIEKDFHLRWATPEERVQVLRTVFDASRW